MKNEKQAAEAVKRKKRKPVNYDRRPGWKRFVHMMLLSLVAALIVEGFNQASPERMLRYLTERTFYFAMNWLIVFASLTVSELIRHRKALSWTITIAWVALGFSNYMVCRNRTQPLVSGDLLIDREILGMVTIYFSWPQIIGAFIAIVLVIFGISWMFSTSAKCRRVKFAKSAGMVTAMMFFTVFAGLLSMKAGLIPETFGNRVDAYRDYGFATCFTYTFGSQGIDKPEEYSTEVVEEILEEIEEPQAEGPRFGEDDNLSRPNIVFLQLESVFDVNTVMGAEFSRDPMPVYHELVKKWPTAQLYVPVIGGGTANVEFEVMSGMNMDFFGAGETPYSTVMQETTCETIANVLRKEGYATSTLHNNTGAFFSRNTVYANLGYDRFVPLEYMLYPEYNEVGWCHDRVITDEVIKLMETSDSRDLVFAIAVESHGKYSDVYEPEEGDIEILSLPEGAYMAPFQNYINVVDDVDAFVGEFVSALEAYNEPVLLVLYGDHLPALGLDSEMLTTGDLYASRYLIWNNYGAEFDAQDMQSYRLGAEVLRQLGISDGVMMKFHQSYPIDEEGEEYKEKLQNLQYDLLYGEQDAYGEAGAYAPTDLLLGAEPVVIEAADLDYRRLMVTGKNFTEYSSIVSGETVLETVFIDAEHIAAYVGREAEQLGESICVAQINPDGKEMGRTAEFTKIKNNTGVPKD